MPIYRVTLPGADVRAEGTDELDAAINMLRAIDALGDILKLARDLDDPVATATVRGVVAWWLKRHPEIVIAEVV